MNPLHLRALPAAAAALLFARMSAAQYAVPPPNAPPPPAESEPPPEPTAPSHRQADLLGSRLDCWRDGVSIVGVRYLHMFEHGGTLEGGFSFPAVAFGLGADVGAINVSAPQDSDKGAIVDAVLRGAVRLPVGWISGEVTSGLATGPGGPIQVGSAGAFWGAYIVDIGYSYAFPFAPAHRPEWLSAGMFSVRVQIPLDVFGSGSEPARESARAH